MASTVADSPLDIDVPFQAHRLRVGFFERKSARSPDFRFCCLLTPLVLEVTWYHEIMQPRWMESTDYPPDIRASREVIEDRVSKFLYLLAGLRYIPVLDKKRLTNLIATRSAPSSSALASASDALPGDSFLSALVTGFEPVVEESAEDDPPEDPSPSRRRRARSPSSSDELPPPPLSQKPPKRKKTPLFYSDDEGEPARKPGDKGKRKAVSPSEDDSDRDAEGEDEAEGEEEIDELEEEEPPKKKARTSARTRPPPVVELSPRNKKRDKKPKSARQGSVELPSAIQIEGDCDECRRVGVTCTRPNPASFRCSYCKAKGKTFSCAYDHLSVQGTVKGKCFRFLAFPRFAC